MSVNQYPSAAKAESSSRTNLVIEPFNEFDADCAGVCICTAVYVLGAPSATAAS
jgi:hypothetical protein